MLFLPPLQLVLHVPHPSYCIQDICQSPDLHSLVHPHCLPRHIPNDPSQFTLREIDYCLRNIMMETASSTAHDTPWLA
jgi:hypothetical protein